jgi:hypothetical protein
MAGGGIFATPRPVPNRLLPVLGGAIVLLVALPVFLIADWPLGGWALGAVLWTGIQALNLLVARMRDRTGNLAAAGVQGFGVFFKATALLVVLAAVAATDGHTAVGAVVTFALAYTCELGLSLVAYFGSGE